MRVNGGKVRHNDQNDVARHASRPAHIRSHHAAAASCGQPTGGPKTQVPASNAFGPGRRQVTSPIRHLQDCLLVTRTGADGIL